MALPPSIEPFLEPEALWHASPRPADANPGNVAVAVLSAAVVVLAMWEDVARHGPWAGLTGPVTLVTQPLSLHLGWLLGGGTLALAAGAWLERRRIADRRATAASAVPRLPVFLRFDGRRVVVVGGGSVAAAKIPALLDAGADVTVVAPDVLPGIDRARVSVIERPFEPADLDGAWFVTAAATPEVNRQVRDAADARAVFVNAVDDAANATAYLGGTIVRGGVTVAISTAGQAPALAGLLREAFDALVPEDIETWATRAHDLSREQRAAGVPMGERRPQLLDALNRLYGSRDVAPADTARARS